MALSKTTQNHDEIKAWAEKRGGKPADVESTETAQEAGILRLEFPDAPNANDANLKEIDWEPFFEKFDKSGLEMIYQEVTAEGAESNFYKFVHPEKKQESGKKTSPTKAAAKTTPAKKSALPKKSVPAKTSAPAKAVAKAPAKKIAVKGVAKKVTATKATAKSIPAKKTPVKKAGAKKTAAKKIVTKKKK